MAKRQDSGKKINGPKHRAGGRLGDEEFQRKLAKSQAGWTGKFAGDGPDKEQKPKAPKVVVAKKATPEEKKAAALLRPKLSKPTYKAGTISRHFLDDGIASLMGLPKNLDRTFYVNVPDADGNNAVFMATGGFFKKCDEKGEEVKYHFVEAYFIEADIKNPLHAHGRKLDSVFVTQSQIHKNEVKKSPTATEQMQEARRVLCGYLHEAWMRAGQQPVRLPCELCPLPDFPSGREVGMPDSMIQEAKQIYKGLDELSVLAKEAAGEAVLTLLEEQKAESSSNPKHFIAGIPGMYRFPRRGPATFVETILEPNGVVRHTVAGVEDGALFPQSIARFSFTADQLAGKTNFPRRFMLDKDMVSVAEREFIDGFRAFLKPYGLEVKEQVVLKKELPKASPAKASSKVVSIETGEAYVAPKPVFTSDAERLRAEDPGEYVFEGVKLSGSRGRNGRGWPRFEMRVLSVPDNHPDCKALRTLEMRDFLATFVVMMEDHYPREKLTPVLLKKADGLEALWRLLRRAFGLSDGTALQNANINPKGKMSA